MQNSLKLQWSGRRTREYVDILQVYKEIFSWILGLSAWYLENIPESLS